MRSFIALVAQVSPCVSFHVIHACALVFGCLSVLSSPVSLRLPQVHLPPFLMSTLVPDENSMKDPLCNSSFGSMVSLDYVTPDTHLVPRSMRERFPCSVKGNIRRALCLWGFRHPSLTMSGISGIRTTAICFSVCASCLVLEPPSCHSRRTHRVTCQRRQQKQKDKQTDRQTNKHTHTQTNTHTHTHTQTSKQATKYTHKQTNTPTTPTTNNQQQFWLNPLSVIRSPSAQPASCGGWPPTQRRGSACRYRGRRCCFFGHSSEEVAAASEVGRDHPMPCSDVAATASLDEVAVRVQRLEQIVARMCKRARAACHGRDRRCGWRAGANRGVQSPTEIPVPQNKEEAAQQTRPLLHERTLERARDRIVIIHVPPIWTIWRRFCLYLWGALKDDLQSILWFPRASDHGEHVGRCA